MSWYKQGLTEIKKTLEEKEKVTKLLKEKTVPWLRLKTGEQANVIMIDDNFFYCEIHTVKIAGSWRNLTCCAGKRPCPICLQEGRRPTPTMFATVLDLRPIRRDDGTVSKYRKVLLGARGTLASQLLEYKEEYGSLIGMKFTLKRYSDKESACGVIKAVELRADGKPKRYNLASLGKDMAVGFDYVKILAPFSNEELEAIGYPVTPVVGDTPVDEILEEEEELQEEELQEETELEEEEIEEDDEEDEKEDKAEEPEEIELEAEEFLTEEELKELEEEIEEEKPKPRTKKRTKKEK